MTIFCKQLLILHCNINLVNSEDTFECDLFLKLLFKPLQNIRIFIARGILEVVDVVVQDDMSMEPDVTILDDLAFTVAVKLL